MPMAVCRGSSASQLTAHAASIFRRKCVARLNLNLTNSCAHCNWFVVSAYGANHLSTMPCAVEHGWHKSLERSRVTHAPMRQATRRPNQYRRRAADFADIRAVATGNSVTSGVTSCNLSSLNRRYTLTGLNALSSMYLDALFMLLPPETGGRPTDGTGIPRRALRRVAVRYADGAIVAIRLA